MPAIMESFKKFNSDFMSQYQDSNSITSRLWPDECISGLCCTLMGLQDEAMSSYLAGLLVSDWRFDLPVLYTEHQLVVLWVFVQLLGWELYEAFFLYR